MSKQKTKKPESYGKYLAAGIIVAGIMFAVFKALDESEKPVPNQWSRAVDSAFVVNCVSKYSREFHGDSLKREWTIDFCLCMLEKVKIKYKESEMDRVMNEEIKEWDRLCREELNKSGMRTK